MKNRIVIIGANSFQNSLILKAKSLGYETHVFAWQCGDVGEFTADYFYPVSIIEKERILQECKKIQPVAVASIGSDLAVLTVNYVARALGLQANSELCDKIATDKYEMRRAFARAGIPVPRFIKITESTDLSKFPQLRYPVIVKPTDRSGSRGVTKVNSREDLYKALVESMQVSFAHTAIVEEFIEGSEYSCECISYKGEHNLLAVTKKFTTGSPHFIEIGHIQPATLPDKTGQGLQKVIFNALDVLDIKNGASHAEFKIGRNREIKIIEIGARMGGDCIGSDLVRMSTGNDYTKMVIDVACGRRPEIMADRKCSPAAVRFLMCEKDMEFLNLEYEGIHIEHVSRINDDFSYKVSDSSSRHGYFLAVSNNREELERVLFGSDK